MSWGGDAALLQLQASVEVERRRVGPKARRHKLADREQELDTVDEAAAHVGGVDLEPSGEGGDRIVERVDLWCGVVLCCAVWCGVV